MSGQTIRNHRRITQMVIIASCAMAITVCTSCDQKPTAEAESDDAAEVTEVVQQASTGGEGQVLRHAVFFKFKDTSSDEQVTEVVNAFRELPAKIDEITDFEWGTNNSPEDHDDGFTHCFLLTFKDEAGRSVYIPHDAHAGQFADVLRPHMEKVFVIDYWGTPPEQPVDKALKHAVFFKFKDDAAEEDIKKVEEAFAALPEKIDAIKALEWGKNNSPEKNDQGFTHCFMVTFDSEAGREAYLPHPEHAAFVEVLLPVLDKVRVLDYWAEQ